MIQNFFKNHFLAYQAFRCYFFKFCKITKFYLKFQYVAKNMKEYYILLYYCQIWLNCLMDDHQLGNITKLKKKLHCPHTTHLSSWPPYPWMKTSRFNVNMDEGKSAAPQRGTLKGAPPVLLAYWFANFSLKGILHPPKP